MKALITAGGHGTRLQPLTHTQNKHMIPIANKPIIHYALEYVADAGVREVGVVINEGDTAIQELLGDGSSWNAKITYIEQSAPLGLAHVVKISQPFIGDEPFVFYLGDNILVGGIQEFVRKFEAEGSNCHLVLSKVKDPERFGVPEIVGERIVSVEEKPDKPKSDYAVTGIYLYDSSIFEAVNNIEPSSRGELEISDAHQYLLENGKAVSYSEITGWWKDTGKPADLLEANRLVLDNVQADLQGRVDGNSYIYGRVVIAEGAQILNSVIRGPAMIGERTIIENSYIGPFTSIYHDCLVQNSEMEFSIMLENSSIKDTGIRIEGSLFGKHVEVRHAAPKPRTQRFMIGDQSRVELI